MIHCFMIKMDDPSIFKKQIPNVPHQELNFVDISYYL